MGIYTDKEIYRNGGLQAFRKNKEVPKVIEQLAFKALSHYPELEHTHIRFIFSQKLKKSVMAARPVVSTLLQSRDKRVYDILISPVFKLTQSIEPIHHLPEEVLIGWLGHELGHIMDYEERTVWGIAKFGLMYWLSKRYVRKAERVADTFAVNRGMASYILSTKEFILGHSELSTRYKEKIARLYLSPDDIVELVSEMEKKTQPEKEELLADETALAQSTQEEDN
ncbi:hypothetical protein [Sphingobacterium chuzhouense]|uniref:Peptidase M48 domain-containing protein n=1 Tax=Sphingobacterium chuzhouense TaxID=1742264 RepID=A0ABR7XTG2_9SPHI|nr:hypothetical protein [Sphingobacterium chuzhouense]MBD1422459.1 hypothetical protein [Sphingobacterium chuzhouense]